MLRVRYLLLSAACSLIIAAHAQARELRVMISGGFSYAYGTLAHQYEKETGNKLITVKGPSMGRDRTAIPNRLAHGEHADVVIMVRNALDKLAAQGIVVPETTRDLGVGIIAAAVRAGARKPDISTVPALRAALLNAKSVAYSDSASGMYLSGQLFKQLGVADVMKRKGIMVQATPVGVKIASGEYDLGFQQLSELKSIPGINILGPIPDVVQDFTLFSAAVVADSTNERASCALIAFLSSPNAAQVVRKSGMLLPKLNRTNPLRCAA